MFDIQQKYQIKLAEWMNIADNYHVFHFDEFPILYAGTNRLGNKVIGSLVCEFDDGDVFRHFHFPVTNKEYNDFIKQRISYRDLIKSQESIYVLDKDINDKIIQAYFTPIIELPDNYLPLEGSLCPNVDMAVGLDFTWSLQGKLADMHEALSASVSSVSKSAYKMLNNFMDVRTLKQLHPQIHQLAFTEGSFKVGFRIKLTTMTLFTNERVLREFLQKCISYSMDNLPEEADKIAVGNIKDTFFEKEIIPLAKELNNGYTEDSGEYLKSVADALIETIDEVDSICSQIGKGFTGIEILGINSAEKEVTIGYIDKAFAEKISTAKKSISQITTPGEEIDDSNKEYRIQIYDLNTDTRKGTALIQNIDQADVMDRVKITIGGEADLTGSIFTESLHMTKWVIIKAKARRLNGKFKTLAIFSE